MSTIQLDSLWQYIQTLSLSTSNKTWLAEKLLESSTKKRRITEAQKETNYITSSPAMMEIIAQGDKQIQSGNYETTKLEDLWN